MLSGVGGEGEHSLVDALARHVRRMKESEHIFRNTPAFVFAYPRMGNNSFGSISVGIDLTQRHVNV